MPNNRHPPAAHRQKSPFFDKSLYFLPASPHKAAHKAEYAGGNNPAKPHRLKWQARGQLYGQAKAFQYAYTTAQQCAPCGKPKDVVVANVSVKKRKNDNNQGSWIQKGEYGCGKGDNAVQAHI